METEIPITAIDFADDTFRYRVTLNVEDLVKSIREHGQQVPVILRKLDDQERLQLICGFRRVTALTQLGIPTVRAHVREQLTDAQAFTLSVLENEKRRSLRDIDRGWAILKYRRAHPKAPVKELEAVFGLRERQLQRLQKLTTLPSVIQAAMGGGVVKATHALVLIQGLGEDAPQGELVQWVRRIEREELSVSDLRRLLRDYTTVRRSPHYRRLVDFRTSARGVTRLRFREMSFRPDQLEDDTREALIRQLSVALRKLEESRDSSSTG